MLGRTRGSVHRVTPDGIPSAWKWWGTRSRQPLPSKQEALCIESQCGTQGNTEAPSLRAGDSSCASGSTCTLFDGDGSQQHFPVWRLLWFTSFGEWRQKSIERGMDIISLSTFQVPGNSHFFCLFVFQSLAGFGCCCQHKPVKELFFKRKRVWTNAPGTQVCFPGQPPVMRSQLRVLASNLCTGWGPSVPLVTPRHRARSCISKNTHS